MPLPASCIPVAATTIPPAGLDISPLVKTYDKNPAYGKPDRIFVGSQGDPKLWADIHEDLTFDAIIVRRGLPSCAPPRP